MWRVPSSGWSTMRWVVSISALLLLLLITTVLAASSNAPLWVHGSWVNVRATPSPDGAIVTRFTANTPVTLFSQQGDWCGVLSSPPSVRGYIACNLLGTKPLSLEEIGKEWLTGDKRNPAYSATQAFWVAPSAVRLIEAGQFFTRTMLSEKQKKAEDPFGTEGEQPSKSPFDWEHRPQPVRFPIAEFDAMKALLQNGIVAASELQQQFVRWADLKKAATTPEGGASFLSGQWVDPEALGLIAQLNIPNVRPSLFKRDLDLASSSASVEHLSAQFAIPERLRVLGGPEWMWPRHNMPRVEGAWDIGSIELSLDRPVVEYLIGRQGSVTAFEWVATDRINIGAEYGCAEGFGLVWSEREKVHVFGDPHVKDPLLWIYLPKPLPYKKVRINTYSALLNKSALHTQDLYERLVTHEVELDGDGVADLLVWEAKSLEIAEVDRDKYLPVELRMFFANIGGEWCLLNTDRFTHMCD